MKDNNIFTIGDKVYTKDPNYVSIIEKFISNNSVVGGMEVWLTSPNGEAMQALGHLKHAKKPLFTTEDGVDVFEGSICWIVGPHFFSMYKWTNPTSIPLIFNEKYFSTEEAAKEYILMNKPCLCINDLMKASSITYCNLTALKELVKSKL